MKYFLSFDIGGTAVKYGIINSDGDILEFSQFPTEAGKGPEMWMLKLVEKAEEYRKKYTLSGLPVSSTAMIDSVHGRVFFSLPQVPGYTGFEVKRFLEEKTLLSVEVENDVNCVAIAESISGAGKGCESVLSIAVGTGIGGGFTEGGKLLRGYTFSAAEVGYIKVEGGTLESMGSTTALVRRVEKMKNLPEGSYNGLRVVKEAGEGDRDCLSALETMTSSIADGLVSLSYILNPAVIVLGGGIMKNEDLVDAVRRKYRASINPLIGSATDIVKAKYDNEAGILGAYYHFLQKHPEAAE